MRPAPGARQAVARHHAVVAAVGIGQQHPGKVLQKLLRSVAGAAQGEVEDVVGMRGVAHIHPHARRLGFARAQHGQHRVVGGHHVRLPHPLGHPAVQGLDQIGHVPAPDRLRGARNLESLPRENVFQPVERQVIGKLAGDDVSQQSRPRQAALDRRRPPAPPPASAASPPQLRTCPQAYFLRTCCRRSKCPGRYSICQLSSAPISWRSSPQHGQARSFPLNS